MFTDLIQQLLFYTNEQIVRFLTCICVRSQSKYGYLDEFRVSKSPGPNLHGRQRAKLPNWLFVARTRIFACSDHDCVAFVHQPASTAKKTR